MYTVMYVGEKFNLGQAKNTAQKYVFIQISQSTHWASGDINSIMSYWNLVHEHDEARMHVVKYWGMVDH